ncbi:MAG: FtsB family cell division protein [Candidatus Bipolaricaulaceae bacterium]
MSRPWRNGQPAKFWARLALTILVLAGIGAIFGLRIRAIAVTSNEVRALREKQSALWVEIEKLNAELKKADDPKVVEEKAREILRWAYPDEDLVILIRKR